MISLFFGLSKVMRGHRSMMQDNREPLIVLPDQPPDVFGSLRLLYWLRQMGSPMRKYDNKLYRVAKHSPGYCPVSAMVLEPGRNNRPILACRLRRSIICCSEIIRALQFSHHALIQRRTA